MRNADYHRPINFNPRSRKESDFLLYVHVPLLSNFNPRSRKESDAGAYEQYGTPTYFNPRSRKESDPVIVNLPIGPEGFQSTLSQGERRLHEISTLV